MKSILEVRETTREKEPSMAKKEEKAPGVGDVATEVILGGGSNEEALAAVQKAFPKSKTSQASINWYRNKLRSEGATLKGSRGKPVPTAREMKAAAKETAEKEAKKTAKATKKAEADPLA